MATDNGWLVWSPLPYSVLPSHLRVDFDALPVEIDLQPGFLKKSGTGILLLFTASVTLLCLLVSLVKPLLGLPLAAFTGVIAYMLGQRLKRSWMYSRTIIVTTENVKVRRGAKVDIVPYDEYIAIRKTNVLVREGKSAILCTVLELVHPQPRLCVPICVAFNVENVEPLLHDYVQRFGLPVWRQAKNRYIVRQPNEFGQRFADRVFSGEVVAPSLLPPPPAGIEFQSHVDESGQEIVRIPIRQTLTSYIAYRSFFIVVLLGFCGWVASFSGTIYGGMIAFVVAIPFWIIGAVSVFRKHEELELKDGVLTARGNQLSNIVSDVKEWSAPLSSIAELFLDAQPNTGLTVISDKRSHSFGSLASKAGRQWLYDYLVHYIRERYVPEAVQAVAAAKSPSLGANQ
ncbi:MAG: hypothetical protein NUV50_10470 [Rhodospirillales bacterium]|nr:hypothetical protein [Rhodospirillales bacterium]